MQGESQGHRRANHNSKLPIRELMILAESLRDSNKTHSLIDHQAKYHLAPVILRLNASL